MFKVNICTFIITLFLYSAGMAGGKYRSFLVHIKAVSDKGVEESPRPVVRMPSAKPQGNKAHSLSTLLQRAQASKVHFPISHYDQINTFLVFNAELLFSLLFCIIINGQIKSWLHLKPSGHFCHI